MMRAAILELGSDSSRLTWFEAGAWGPVPRRAWYEPAGDVAAIDRLLRALGRWDARLADVLAQFQPVELTGLEEASMDAAAPAEGRQRQSDAIAVAAVAIAEVMRILGAEDARISAGGRG